MKNKKKIAAVGAAVLVGAAGYGVYATTLNVTDGGTSFAAGSAEQGQVSGFGSVSIDPGTPSFDPTKSEFYFKELTITPTGGSDWKNVSGKTIKVVAYDKSGKELGSGTEVVNPALGTKADAVPLTFFDANAVTTWGIVIQ